MRAEDTQTPDAMLLLDELSERLSQMTGSSGKASFDVNDVRGDRACFVVARDTDAKPVGCGALRPLTADIAELKRMYSRGTLPGIGAALLAHLEAKAQQLGYTALRLETRAVNGRAVAFYERHGYRRIANFGRYAGRPEAVCFEKSLTTKHDESDQLV
ncbi:acetyltransferase [Duganella sp. Leaf126]|nr:acetyltransferase [Duganella sp. Leaf126]